MTLQMDKLLLSLYSIVELAYMMRPLIVKAAQSLSDGDAAQAPFLYDEWSGNGVKYAKDYKIRRHGKVYRVIVEHTSQPDWAPEVAASLFTVIDEVHLGTLQDPIPYDGNMEIFSGKYYVQNHVVYLCTRDSNTPLHHALKELVGLYVEVSA